MYTWTDASALYQIRYYYNDDTLKGISAEAYLLRRLAGFTMDQANDLFTGEK